MDYLETALDHAAKGYFVFPAQANKRPVYGFNDWEGNASMDPQLIKSWWSSYSSPLPAIAPGRSGHAVVDVDKHEGKPDGDVSLENAGIVFDSSVFSGTSISGNGKHFWFRANVGSVNGVLPSVDRKANGGYVIAPYTLPVAESISSPLPSRLSVSPASVRLARRNMSSKELDEWLDTIGAGPMTSEMYDITENFRATGNSHMSRDIARVVTRAAHGVPGARKALDKMSDIWVSAEHSTGDPEAEFVVNVRSAVEKFGALVVRNSPEDELLLELNPPVFVNVEDLMTALYTYCGRIYPEWQQHPKILVASRRCRRYLEKYLSGITTRDSIDHHRSNVKNYMDRIIGENRNG